MNESKVILQRFFLIIQLIVLIPSEFIIVLSNSFAFMGDVIDLLAIVLMVSYGVFVIVTNKMPTLITWLLLVLQLWLLIVTFNEKELFIKTAVGDLTRVVAVCLMIEYYRRNLNNLVSAFESYYYIVVAINFLTLIVFYPNGILTRIDGTPLYFLGYRNAFALWFFPAIMFSLLRYEKNKKCFYIVFSMCFFSMFIEKSASTIVALIVGIVFFIIIKNANLQRNKIICFFEVLSYLLLNVFIFSINKISELPIIKYVVEDLLGRKLTFTGRTTLWEIAFNMISENPVNGYGIGANVFVKESFWHAHNQILEYLIEGGIIALGIFFGVLVLLCKRICQNRSLVQSRAFMVTIIMLFLYFLVEPATKVYFVPIYVFICNFYRYQNPEQKDTQRRVQVLFGKRRIF